MLIEKKKLDFFQEGRALYLTRHGLQNIDLLVDKVQELHDIVTKLQESVKEKKYNMRFVSIFLAVIFPLALFSQAIACKGDCSTALPPIGEEGTYEVQHVVEAKGQTAAQLYGAAKVWFASNYNSVQDVIQSDDSANYVIVGRAWSGIPLTVMGVATEQQLWYTLKVEAKDGRARYTIYNMEYDGSSEMATYRKPLSQAFFEDRFRKGKKLKARDAQLRRGWIENVNALAASLEKALTAPATYEDDW